MSVPAKARCTMEDTRGAITVRCLLRRGHSGWCAFPKPSDIGGAR